MPGVIAAVDDLFFAAKIQETARRLSLPLSLVRSPEELMGQARRSHPALVIFDLNATGCEPLIAIRRLKADPALRAIPTLGFFSHVQRELRAAATEAGCDRVVARSAFTAELAEILGQHAT